MTEIVAAPAVLPDWAARAVNLASPRLGTTAVRCSDDAFGAMARMLADAPAVFKPGVFDDFGKWMDGWETRRRRRGGHDWCVVRLGARGVLAGVDIDTSHFTGNFPPAASLWAADTPEEPGEGDWTEIVAATPLGPSAHHLVVVTHPGPWRWLRLNMYPDGGIARLRVYGQPAPDWGAGAGEVELSALHNGGRTIAWNNAHYGDVWAVLAPGRGAHMGDGWETRRRREPGHDWLILALGAPGVLTRLQVDTAHFKGNYPDRVSVQAAMVTWGDEASLTPQAMFWPTLLAEQPLGPDAIHDFNDLAALGPVSHLRLNIHPDGGVSRFRAFGQRTAT